MGQATTVSDKATSILHLKQRIQKFVNEREWGKYHNPKNLSMAITVEAGELMELFQWLDERGSIEAMKDSKRRTRVKEELADVFIYCLDMAAVLDIDLTRAVLEKIGKNESKYPVDQVKGHYRKYTEI
jgi:NTP pyrophosphatase (non-canonical NTP hydrolase)